MRILFWSELFWPYIGGAEISAAKLLPALRERSHEFMVVTSQDYLDLPDEGEYQGIPIYRFPFRKAVESRNIDLLVETCQRVARLKRSFQPDLVHVHSVGPSALFYLQIADVSPGPRLVRMNYEIFPNSGADSSSLQGRVLHTADWVNCVSAATLAQVHQWVPELVPRSSVIYNGYDMPCLLPEPLPSEIPQLLCLGRLVPQKGFDLALSAVASIVDRFPHIRLIVAGDGPLRSALEQQTADLGLQHVVKFIGWVKPDEVPALMNTATMVVMPSRSEGLPLVAVEAALMARPIIATRVGGLPEIVLHQQTGLLVQQEDSTALAEAISFFLTQPERATHLGQAARQRAQELFGWESCVDAYDSLYRKLIHPARQKV